MTLKVRNRLLLVFFAAALAFSIVTIASFANAAVNERITRPSLLVRLSRLPEGGLFGSELAATTCAVIAFCVYSVLTTIFVYFHFEKTQALEIIYFCGFLIGCLCEGMRLIIPSHNIWYASSVQIFVTRIMLVGRTIAPLAFLFSIMFNDTEKRQYVERNFVIMVQVAIMTGLLYPLQTLQITTTFTVGWGLRGLFFFIRICMVLATIGVMVYKGLANNSAETLRQIIGYAVLITGYFLLCAADCYPLFAAGALFLVAGTLHYLFTLHEMYLWK